MATYQRKVVQVEARVYDGPKLIVVSDDKGSQVATTGDYLVGTEPHKVTVVSKAEFERDFEPVTAPAAVVPVAPVAPVEPVVVHFATVGEAQDYVASNVKPGEELRFTVGDDPTVQVAK